MTKPKPFPIRSRTEQNRNTTQPSIIIIMSSKQRRFLEAILKPFTSHRTRDGSGEEDLEAIAAREQKIFPYQTLAAATSNFGPKNKLGEGGFGPVYKGRLVDGREVAVKKLSHGSKQGSKEFMNEAMLLSRVQHRNIVNLYGYCASQEGEENQEKLLVYEYVPHESLDKILFDAKKKLKLDWKQRYDIIVGVARGILYLHEDSHTTIIHRDIKASNILLDDKWIPKIADFGMARLYPENQTHVNTRIAGTNGYMAPEYLMHGQLSKKVDVFSFGVLVLELVSGQKNSTYIFQHDAQGLLDWVWKLHKKGNDIEMMDPALQGTESVDQVAMCIHLGLLCTQADPKLRPDMARVVVILSKKPSTLEEPMKPGFPGSRYRRSHGKGESSSSRTMSSTSSASAITSNTNSGTAATISPRLSSELKRKQKITHSQ